MENNMDKEAIFNKLNKIIENSSSKYYHYPVAAILECIDGTLYPGVNIETSSPGAGICAERCAIFYAMANGLRKEHFNLAIRKHEIIDKLKSNNFEILKDNYNKLQIGKFDYYSDYEKIADEVTAVLKLFQ